MNLLAEEWGSKGARVFYTVFENNSGNPPSQADIAQYEAGVRNLLGVTDDEDIPIRALNDRVRNIPVAFRNEKGAGLLPFIVLIDENMVIIDTFPGNEVLHVHSLIQDLIYK